MRCDFPQQGILWHDTGCAGSDASLACCEAIMSLDQAIEEIIQRAMQEGVFDNLPGKGKPQNLDAYFATPEDVRVGYSVLRSAGFLPEEAQLLREVGDLRERLAAATDPTEKASLARALNLKTLAFDTLVEKQRAGRCRKP